MHLYAMLGHKIRKFTKKACTGIFRIFSDNISNSNKKYIFRDNHLMATTSHYCPVQKSAIYYQGLSKNFKLFPSVYKYLYAPTKSQIRLYSSNQTNGLPALTSLPQEIWPGFFNPFSNLFLIYLVIKPYVDSSFDMKEFMLASKQVVQIVSRKLAAGDTDSLADMVTPDTFREIKENLPKYSLSQRQELVVDPEDIYFYAPSRVSLTNDHNSDKKVLEIGVIYHVMKDFKETERMNENSNPFNTQNMQQFQPPNLFESMKLDESKIHILNYRFVREYFPDNAGDWLLSGVNHYRKSQIEGLPF